MKRVLGGLIAGVVLLLTPAAASAHPLGNFTVNRYSRIEVGPDAIQLRYVLDLAEIPTLQELGSDATARSLDPSARQRLRDTKTAELAAGAQLTMDGRPVSWRLESAALDFLPGQADLDTLRVEVTLVAPSRAAEDVRIVYQDTNYSGRIGWHEVVLRGSDGIVLRGSTVSAVDETNELRSYPTDPTVSPLDVSSARATVALSGGPDAGATRADGIRRFFSISAPVQQVPAELTGFIRGEAGTNPLAVLAAFALAALLGAMHGLGPGHGKTLVAAYLVGTRGTPRHAALLGLTVTVTHTVGVYALGVVTLLAARFIVPETLYPVITLASGLMVLGIGVTLVRTRLRGARDSHVHAHEHGHDHVHEHGHSHTHPQVGGHVHASRTHSHEVPERARDALMPRNLLMLGVSGGILPCPTALVLLLAAVSFHNIPLGLVLVFAFSLGLAGILTAIGLLVVFGGRVLGRGTLGAHFATSRAVRLLPALGAIVITFWGLAITAQAALSFL